MPKMTRQLKNIANRKVGALHLKQMGGDVDLGKFFFIIITADTNSFYSEVDQDLEGRMK